MEAVKGNAVTTVYEMTRRVFGFGREVDLLSVVRGLAWDLTAEGMICSGELGHQSR